MKFTQCVRVVVCLCFFAGGCAIPANQGRMIRSGEVAQLIESATVLPDHVYYYTGPEAGPDAIIALDNRYTLKSKYWIRVDAVAEQLKLWNRLLDNDTRITNPYEGAWIMTPNDRRAGIWYSKYDQNLVRFPDSSTIIIYTPITSMEGRTPSWGHLMGPPE